jgi:hypothetical protein
VLACDAVAGGGTSQVAEYVELLTVAQAVVTAALTALATGYVTRFLDKRKAKDAEKAARDQPAAGAVAPDGRPLFALTIVNESCGTVVVLDRTKTDDVAATIGQVTSTPTWRGRTLIG